MGVFISLTAFDNSHVGNSHRLVKTLELKQMLSNVVDALRTPAIFQTVPVFFNADYCELHRLGFWIKCFFWRNNM
jgi:hypothetical protein